MKEKAELEKEHKATDDAAAEKYLAMMRKVKSIGNIVHESVPTSNNEVGIRRHRVPSEAALTLG